MRLPPSLLAPGIWDRIDSLSFCLSRPRLSLVWLEIVSCRNWLCKHSPNRPKSMTIYTIATTHPELNGQLWAEVWGSGLLPKESSLHKIVSAQSHLIVTWTISSISHLCIEMLPLHVLSGDLYMPWFVFYFGLATILFRFRMALLLVACGRCFLALFILAQMSVIRFWKLSHEIKVERLPAGIGWPLNTCKKGVCSILTGSFGQFSFFELLLMWLHFPKLLLRIFNSSSIWY